MLCGPGRARSAALGGLPPLRGFAPQTPQAPYSTARVRRQSQ